MRMNNLWEDTVWLKQTEKRAASYAPQWPEEQSHVSKPQQQREMLQTLSESHTEWLHDPCMKKKNPQRGFWHWEISFVKHWHSKILHHCK